MIQFKLYSKSPKDMTDKEAKEAKYRDTSKPSFIKPAAKVGALAGGALGLKKSLGKKGLGGTALRVGLGTLGGAWAGAKAGALADIGSSAVNYGGRRIAKSAKGAVKSVKDEAKKFSISDTPGKRAGLVAAGTTAGAVGGGLLGASNVHGLKSVSDKAKKSGSIIKNSYKSGGLLNSIKTSKRVGKTLLKNEAIRKGGYVGALTALGAGMYLTSDKKRKMNKEYNRELKIRKSQIGK